MSMTMRQILDARNPNTDSILHAARYFVSERFGDVPPSEMREALLDAGIPESELDSTIKSLESDLSSLEDGSLLVLDSALQARQGDSATIERALDEATTKLPVVETAILALVVMYGLYLLTPASDKPIRVIRRKLVKKDGSIETSSDASYHEPTGALAAVVDLLSGARARRKR